MADVLKNPTPYEQYRNIIMRARSAGEIGTTYPQTPLQRVMAGLVSFAPTLEDLQGAYQWMTAPMDIPGPTLQQSARAALGKVPAMLDLQDVGVQNNLIGLGSLGAMALKRPPAELPTPGALSPRHTSIRGGRPYGMIGGPFENPARSEFLAKYKNDLQPLSDAQLADEFNRVQDLETMPGTKAHVGKQGALNLIREEINVRTNPVRSALSKMSDEELWDATHNLAQQFNEAPPGSNDQWVIGTAHRVYMKELARRGIIGPEDVPTPPKLSNPVEEQISKPPSRFDPDRVIYQNGSRLTHWPTDPELMKARERVRARERRANEKAAELQAPPEETMGKKLGPAYTGPDLPTWEENMAAFKKAVKKGDLDEIKRRQAIGDAILDEGAGQSPGLRTKQFENSLQDMATQQKYEQAYHTIHEGTVGPINLGAETPYNKDDLTRFVANMRSQSDMDLLTNWILGSGTNWQPLKQIYINELRRRRIIPPDVTL